MLVGSTVGRAGADASHHKSADNTHAALRLQSPQRPPWQFYSIRVL